MSLGSTEVLIIVVILLLLFGAKRIPTLMREMGRSITEFKKGLKAGKEEETKEEGESEKGKD